MSKESGPVPSRTKFQSLLALPVAKTPCWYLVFSNDNIYLSSSFFLFIYGFPSLILISRRRVVFILSMRSLLGSWTLDRLHEIWMLLLGSMTCGLLDYLCGDLHSVGHASDTHVCARTWPLFNLVPGVDVMCRCALFEYHVLLLFACCIFVFLLRYVSVPLTPELLEPVLRPRTASPAGIN